MVLIAGVDEAGRGALAGPVVAAAVVLRETIHFKYPDSKKVSASRRIDLVGRLYGGDAHLIAIGWSSHTEIDRVNILQATLLAMRRAVSQIVDEVDAVLVDGTICPNSGLIEKALPRADDLFSCVGAASLIAKVFRDRWMLLLDEDYPEYGFAGHKGYGAAIHMQAIRENGGCEWHRKSFAPLRQQELLQ